MSEAIKNIAAFSIAMDFVGFVVVVVVVLFISLVYFGVQLIKQMKEKRNKDNHGGVKR